MESWKRALVVTRTTFVQLLTYFQISNYDMAHLAPKMIKIKKKTCVHLILKYSYTYYITCNIILRVGTCMGIK